AELPAAGDQTSENLQFASAIAAYGLWLRDSQYKGGASLSMAQELAQGSLGEDPYGLRAEFVDLLKKAAKLK
ncbi:MAG: DUF3520 domain-containing protein, partial [Bacteroidales bacterium]|nr:DUF3520 domain-containing protein [Bacteroidales bacterium]